MTKKDLRDAAVMIRAVLDAVEEGQMEASTPPSRALLRRMEGAAAALEEASRSSGRTQG